MLCWRLSNTLDARFCTDALTEALERYGRPEIFNTDQGSQFTSQDFTSVLNESGVAISMDGRGRCMDNIFIERVRRSTIHGALTQPWGESPLPRPMTVDYRQRAERKPLAPLPLSRLHCNIKMR